MHRFTSVQANSSHLTRAVRVCLESTKMSCATDATRYAHLNLPTVIFGAIGFGTHAKQERVSLQSLVEYMELFTEYLKTVK